MSVADLSAAEKQLVRHLKSGYMRMSPVLDLFGRADWTLPTDWSVLQERVFAEIVNDALLLRYPVTVSYRHLFISTFLKRIESIDGAELFDPLVDALLSKGVGSTGSTDDSSYCYRIYEVVDGLDGSGDRFVVRTNSNVISTTGLAMWDAGIRLLEYSIAHVDEFAGRHVLELGCGTALAALHWQRHCRVVTLTDYAPQVLQNAQHNMSLPENGPSTAELRFELLDMARCSDDDLAALVADVDVIAAADVLYTEELVDCVSDVIFRLLQIRPSAYVLLGQTMRTRELVDAFAERLAKHRSLEVEDLTTVCSSDPVLIDIPFRSLVRLLKIRFAANREE